jgi:hypothetical protein
MTTQNPEHEDYDKHMKLKAKNAKEASLNYVYLHLNNKTKPVYL